MIYSESGSCPNVIYLFEVENDNIRAMCETCSKLKIKTRERLRDVSNVIVVPLFVTLNRFHTLL